MLYKPSELQIYHINTLTYIHTHKYNLSSTEYLLLSMTFKKKILPMWTLNIVMFLVMLLLMESGNSGKQSRNELISYDEDIFRSFSFYIVLKKVFVCGISRKWIDLLQSFNFRYYKKIVVHTLFSDDLQINTVHICLPHCPNVTISLGNPTYIAFEGFHPLWSICELTKRHIFKDFHCYF